MPEAEAPCMLCYPFYCPASAHTEGMFSGCPHDDHNCSGYTAPDWNWQGEGPPLYGCKEEVET